MLLRLRSREELLDDVGLSSLQEEVDLVARYGTDTVGSWRRSSAWWRASDLGGTSRGKSEVFREATMYFVTYDMVLATLLFITTLYSFDAIGWSSMQYVSKKNDGQCSRERRGGGNDGNSSG